MFFRRVEPWMSVGYPKLPQSTDSGPTPILHTKLSAAARTNIKVGSVAGYAPRRKSEIVATDGAERNASILPRLARNGISISMQ